MNSSFCKAPNCFLLRRIFLHFFSIDIIGFPPQCSKPFILQILIMRAHFIDFSCDMLYSHGFCSYSFIVPNSFIFGIFPDFGLQIFFHTFDHPFLFLIVLYLTSYIVIRCGPWTSKLIIPFKEILLGCIECLFRFIFKSFGFMRHISWILNNNEHVIIDYSLSSFNSLIVSIFPSKF